MHRVFFPSIHALLIMKKCWLALGTDTAKQLNTDSFIHYELMIMLVERFLVLLSSYLSYSLSFLFINPLAAIYCLHFPPLLFLHYNNKVAAFE